MDEDFEVLDDIPADYGVEDEVDGFAAPLRENPDAMSDDDDDGPPRIRTDSESSAASGFFSISSNMFIFYYRIHRGASKHHLEKK